MLIVGTSLKDLIKQFKIVDDERAFDNTSITLRLDKQFITLSPPPDAEITYGHHIPSEWVLHQEIPDDGIVLKPKSSILGCSAEIVRIPLGYFGFIQTKGSLARLFVLVHCADSQIDTGFEGKVTFEIVNLSDVAIRLLPYQPVAQLFIIKTSTYTVEPYNGRYQHAMGPTIQKPLQ